MAEFLDYTGLKAYHDKQTKETDAKIADEIAKKIGSGLHYTDDTEYEALEVE